jgi:hypothetical protein
VAESEGFSATCAKSLIRRAKALETADSQPPKWNTMVEHFAAAILAASSASRCGLSPVTRERENQLNKLGLAIRTGLGKCALQLRPQGRLAYLNAERNFGQ